MSEAIVRDARQQDADAIAAIHVAAWEFTYRDKLLPDDVIDARSPECRRAFWRERLGELQEGEFVFVVEEDGRPIGFGHCEPSDRPGADPRREVLWRSFYMDPEFVGSGRANLLRIEGVERLYRHGYEILAFWVVAGNERARSWFRTEPTGDERLVEGGRVREELHRVDIERYLADLTARGAEAPEAPGRA
jgi:hypothetical protein